MSIIDFDQIVDLQLRNIDEFGTDDVIRLQKLADERPNDWETLFDLAMAYKQMALNRNMLLCQKAECQLPEDAEEIPQVDLSSTRPVFEKALACFEKARQLNPDIYGVDLQLGVIYGNLGDTDKAIASYKRAIDDDPEDFASLYYLGITYKDLGRIEEARSYLLKAKEINPEDEMLNEDLAELEK